VSVYRHIDVSGIHQNRMGPLVNGYLTVRGKYVYHYMVAVPMSLICLIMSKYDLFGFCLIMILHGLIYNSKYCTKQKSVTATIAIDVDNMSESLDDMENDVDNTELIDVSDDVAENEAL
jgi:hypothetical protein